MDEDVQMKDKQREEEERRLLWMLRRRDLETRIPPWKRKLIPDVPDFDDPIAFRQATEDFDQMVKAGAWWYWLMLPFRCVESVFSKGLAFREQNSWSSFFLGMIFLYGLVLFSAALFFWMS